VVEDDIPTGLFVVVLHHFSRQWCHVRPAVAAPVPLRLADGVTSS